MGQRIPICDAKDVIRVCAATALLRLAKRVAIRNGDTRMAGK